MRKQSVVSIVVLLLMAILLPLAASGQDNTQSTANNPQPKPASPTGNDSDQATEGIDRGGYHIDQSLTLGYRFTRTYGNDSFFSDLVNVQQGPRLLDQVLSMRSPTHTGAIFDNLYVSSFGWGGDAFNGARWNVSKGNVYNFTGSWRRDQNYFDYNLFTNPLNPPATGTPAYPNAAVVRVCTINGTPTIATTCPAGSKEQEVSPHQMQLRRRMADLSLTLFPQSAFSLRLGYARNNMTGPSFSSFHEGTDVLLLQPWDTTVNQYRVGLDFKIFPKTIISYDQFLNYFDNKTDWSLAPLAVFDTATGIPVSFGLPWNLAGGSPCSAPFTPAGSNTANPACNAYQSYTRSQLFHSNQPTEQLMVQSRYLKWVDFVAIGRYSVNDTTDPLNENFLGVVTRTNERAFTLTGPAKERRLITDLNLSATVHLSDTWRVPVTYVFFDSRMPGSFDSVETVFTPPTTALIGGPVGPPTVTPDLFATFFGIKRHDLQAEIEHDFSKSFGARLGTRWGRRDYNVRNFEEPEPDITEINEYTGLLGLWYRTTKGFRANADVEVTSADNFLVRISPRNQQRYRARISYTPKPWAVASVFANFWEGRNGEADIRFKGRNRNLGFNLDVTPNERFGIDLAYNFNLWSQNSFICFIGSLSPPGTVDIRGTTDVCTTAESGALTSRLYSFYDDHIHYGSIAFYVKPVKRFTANLGYSITNSDGTATILNALQPLGPLTSVYHQPLVNLAFEPYQHVTFNLGYNYWNYNEGQPGSGFVALPRNFHANVSTVSVRYAF